MVSGCYENSSEPADGAGSSLTTGAVAVSGAERHRTAAMGFRGNGETRNRTEDTTIFSRVLYQLSYLAVGPQWYRRLPLVTCLVLRL